MQSSETGCGAGTSFLTPKSILLSSNLICCLSLSLNGKMRLSPESLSALPLVIGFALSPSTVSAAAFRHAGQPVGLIDNANTDNTYRDARGSGFPGLTWLRESVSEIIFGHPSTKHSDSTSPSVSVPLSRYRDDVVVRFNVTNPRDQTLLGQAAKENRMDVWASTPQFVDIRLQKDQLRLLLTRIPVPLETQWSVLIPDLEGAVWATYPTKDVTGELEDAAGKLDAAYLKGNIFFHDYQPLSVSPPILGSIFPWKPKTVNCCGRRLSVTPWTDMQ